MSLNNRYEFVLLFDVKDGNPNGDPDAGNLPRVDAETGMGLVTDVCLKRKVRNFVQITQQDSDRNNVFVKSKELSGFETVLNKEIREGYEKLGIDLQSEKDSDGATRKPKGKAQGSEIATGREFMCKHFYDIRTFGAVMSTGPNAGQVRGPVQLTFSRSIDPVVASEHSITVCAARTEEKSYNEQVGIQGRKFTVPYGLYRCHGFISAHLAKQTGFDDDDLELFWQSLLQMFDHDRSASRGEMSARGLYVFKHKDALGNAPASDLFQKINIKLKDGAEVARSPDDYQLTIDDAVMNEGVEFITRLNYWKK